MGMMHRRTGRRTAIIGVLTWLAATLLIAAAAPAGAANRLALVIGNDTYKEVAPLGRAVDDARAYRDLLTEQRGFRVFYAENAGRREMNARVAEFLSAIQPGDTAMVVYSGHGVQLETERRDSLYLLPVDFPNHDPGRGAETHFFDAEALNFARLAENVAARGAKLRIFVLDACRNNPFKRETGTRAIGMTRGIGRIQSSSGEFVIYAAAPGEVAFDSLPGDAPDSVNSVFTRSFIKYFREGAYLEDVANDVQAEVVNLARAANVEQEPYYSDGVAGRTCLEENCGQQATAADAAADAEKEELYWGYCESKDEPAYCQAYLAAFPDAWRAPLARARLAELTATTGDAMATRDGTEVVERQHGDDATRDATGEKLPQTGGGDDVRVAALDPDKTTGVDAANAAATDEVFEPTRDEVRDTQARLTILGHRPGPIDGLIGGRTRAAIAAFQDASGLPASGEFTRGLMARLDQEVPQGPAGRVLPRACRGCRPARGPRTRGARAGGPGTGSAAGSRARGRGTRRPGCGGGSSGPARARSRRGGGRARTPGRGRARAPGDRGAQGRRAQGARGQRGQAPRRQRAQALLLHLCLGTHQGRVPVTRPGPAPAGPRQRRGPRPPRCQSRWSSLSWPQNFSSPTT